MRDRNVILLEFNEICPPLLDRWIKAGELPNFERFYDDSSVFVTEADVTDPQFLEPWIQWYSVHTGLPYDQHGVYRLTDGPEAGHDDIWKILLAEGRRVGNFSSMNARRFDTSGSFFLPDPWCTSQSAYPGELDIFRSFVANAVQEYTNVEQRPRLGDYARFVRYMATHGLRPKAAARITRQVLEDSVLDKTQSWKRVSLLDVMQFEVFRHYYRQYQPDFATFFINSTAHYQHAYWRFMEPEKFQSEVNPRDAARYKDAVLYGYQCMDKLLGEFFKLESAGATLVLMSGLSQQPFVRYEGIGGQRFFRPRDIEGFLKRLGVAYDAIEPVMTHQYMLRLPDPTLAQHCLSRLQCSGDPLFDVWLESDSSLYFGCQLRKAIAEDATITGSAGNAAEQDVTLRFFDHFYQIDETKSGCHHPDGILWFKTGVHRVHESRVSVLDVLPTLLDHFGSSCGGALPGRSLIPLLQPGEHVSPRDAGQDRQTRATA